MMGRTDRVSEPLLSALATFKAFLQPDDDDRAHAIKAADTETLAAMAETVGPLYGEINAVLDRLVAEAHPLPEDLELLEVELNALAEAAMEAEQELLAPRTD